MDPEALSQRNFYTEKHNLVLVCRFVIKTILDKASVGEVDETSPEVINLLATIEHILNHKLKGGRSFFSDGAPPSFWLFIKESLLKLSDNSSLVNVLSLQSLKSNMAKGRAWLRYSLMQKKLADYIRFAVSESGLLMKYYQDGAIIKSEEMHLLIEDLVGLGAVDFSFCLKSKGANLEGRILVDYSPYLHFEHCTEGIEHDLQEISDSTQNTSSRSLPATRVDKSKLPDTRTPAAIRADSDLKQRLAALQRAFRTTSEQKGYLEQMLRRSELSLHQSQQNCERLTAENEELMHNHSKEVKHFEGIILELQNEITNLKTNNKELQRSIKYLYSRNTDVMERAGTVLLESGSLVSDNMSLEDLHLKDDSTSLQPLYGSLISDGSGLLSTSDKASRSDPSLSMPNSSSHLESKMIPFSSQADLYRRVSRQSDPGPDKCSQDFDASLDFSSVLSNDSAANTPSTQTEEN